MAEGDRCLKIVVGRDIECRYSLEEDVLKYGAIYCPLPWPFPASAPTRLPRKSLLRRPLQSMPLSRRLLSRATGLATCSKTTLLPPPPYRLSHTVPPPTPSVVALFVFSGVLCVCLICGHFPWPFPAPPPMRCNSSLRHARVPATTPYQ